MRVAVVGVGAIGGWVAARLCLAGATVRVLARGATLQAVRQGLVLEQEGRTVRAAPMATDDPDRIGPQDVLVIAVKAPALAGLAPRLAPMIGPATAIVPMMNGVPWWFADTPLDSVDPAGAIARALPVGQVVGCVVHASCATPAPAHIVVKASDGVILGAAGEAARPLVESVATLFGRSEIAVRISEAIRRDVWYKLWGNMTANPVSALTRATTDRLLDDPLVALFMRSVMAEAAAIGARIGCAIAESGEDRQAVTRRLGSFRTSMLQDVEAGRPLEVDALLAAPCELGRRVGVPTPSMDTLLGLTRLLDGTIRSRP